MIPIVQPPTRPRPGLVARREVELEIVELAVPTPSRRSEFPAPPFSLEIVSVFAVIRICNRIVYVRQAIMFGGQFACFIFILSFLFACVLNAM